MCDPGIKCVVCVCTHVHVYYIVIVYVCACVCMQVCVCVCITYIVTVCVLCVGVYYLHYYSVCDVLITISHVLLSPESISMLKCD